MTKPRPLLIIFAGMLAAGVAAFFLFHPGEASRIKNRFAVLEKQAAKSADETEIRAAIKARKIRELFADPCDIEILSYGISQRFSASEIPANVMAARAQYTRISLEFGDMKIAFPDEKTAVVEVTGLFKAKTAFGESINEIHQAKCRMIKIERDWFFSEVQETAGN
jgi:hypothetical protein